MRPAPVIVIDHDRAHGEFVAAVLDAAGVDAIVVESDVPVPASPWRGAHERREEVVRTIKTSAFRTVFQPMVALYKSEVVGYEALTRFDEGGRPDQWFMDASALGLGTELELATLASAVAAAHALPAGRFVTLNLSPELLLARREELGEALRELIEDRTVVLELTEHDVIEDYEGIHASLAALSPQVQLSVDDAGAGFSTLRHVLMLEPEYVKLDRAWVSDIHADPTRQALVAGLSHFARTTGCELVAEGIESEHERATLQDLDVSLGQGYLLGPPDDVAP
ncbi:MAG TPA: EAL domain-containing protein [Acidimicrobiales bacterium]|nr:EAL domain-containing protein [Acidimicrobiales bacterium]